MRRGRGSQVAQCVEPIAAPQAKRRPGLPLHEELYELQAEYEQRRAERRRHLQEEEARRRPETDSESRFTPFVPSIRRRRGHALSAPNSIPDRPPKTMLVHGMVSRTATLCVPRSRRAWIEKSPSIARSRRESMCVAAALDSAVCPLRRANSAISCRLSDTRRRRKFRRLRVRARWLCVCVCECVSVCVCACVSVCVCVCV